MTKFYYTVERETPKKWRGQIEGYYWQDDGARFDSYEECLADYTNDHEFQEVQEKNPRPWRIIKRSWEVVKTFEK